MRSSIQLQLTAAQAEADVTVQSVSHYHAHIELFECTVKRDIEVDYSVPEPAIFMYVELKNNSCYFCFKPVGNYRRKVPAGANQIMLITFRTDWLLYKCEKLPELNAITAAVSNPRARQMSLPAIGIGRSLFAALKRMSRLGADPGDAAYHFISGCINKYYSKLAYRNQKTAELSAFVEQNFNSDAVETLPELASRFLVSNRTMARLADVTFGIPLHTQVIKMRMNYALELLLTTRKPIFEIAAMCGYSDAHYFGKAFKKYFGECPGLLRKMRKKARRIETQQYSYAMLP